MAESKHTPGPWAVEDPMGADVGLWIVQSGLEPRQWSCIAMVTDDEDGTARDEGGRFIGRSEQEANARLIAAAPELLEALAALEAVCPEEFGCGLGCQSEHERADDRRLAEALAKARAAIAKAEGRS